MRSIDGSRERDAPDRYEGRSLQGDAVAGRFETLTLVVAIKADCMGCRGVLEAPRGAFGDVDVLVVAREVSNEPWWYSTPQTLVVSETLLHDLDVRWPPFYVLVDPGAGRVMVEGVVFAPEQVAQEIASYLV